MTPMLKEPERVAGTQAGHQLETVWHAMWQQGARFFQAWYQTTDRKWGEMFLYEIKSTLMNCCTD